MRNEIIPKIAYCFVFLLLSFAEVSCTGTKPIPTDEIILTPTRSATKTIRPVTEPTTAPTITPTPFGGSRLIAFVSDEENDIFQLYTYDVDQQVRTFVPGPEGTTSVQVPVWSPDGSMFAITAEVDEAWDLYVLNADGTDIRNVTQGLKVAAFPDWSPDGQELAFTCVLEETADLCLIDVDGTNLQQLTDGPATDLKPSWSPDGSYIVFQSDRDPELPVIPNYDLYVIAVDGGKIWRLTQDNHDDLNPAWSPDGAWIAFESNRTGNYEIFLIKSDGEDLKQLTNNEGIDAYAAWSPDGKQILFETDRNGNWDIYTIIMDGTGLTAMITSPTNEAFPDWQPSQKLGMVEKIEITLPSASAPTVEDMQPEVPLTDEGPWLVFHSPIDENLFGLNEDGTGLRAFDVPHPLSGRLFTAPSGGRIAYIAGKGSYANPDLRLIIVQLPDGIVEFETALFHDSWREEIDETGRRDIDVFQAIDGSDSMAWSQDGRYLAFIGALHGPSADLYLYDRRDGSVRRLTTGENHAYAPSWSPDDKWIVHIEVDNFGTGAGWNMRAIWGVETSTWDVVRLLETNGRMYKVEMWVSNKQFILSEWDAGFGPNNLSTHNVNGEGPIWFYKGSFTQTVFDSAGSRIVLGLGEYAAADMDVEQGVYLLPRYGGDPTPIITGGSIETETFAWSESLDQFVVGLNEEVVFFDRQGNITRRIEQGGEAYIAPNGEWLALNTKYTFDFDLFTTKGEFVRQLFNGSVEEVLWLPSSEGIFYVSEDDLYLIQLGSEDLMSESELVPSLIKQNVPDWDFYYHWVVP